MRSDGSALSVQRWLRSARFAWDGITHTFQTQPNFRIELTAAVVALSLALLLHAPLAPILLCCTLVLSLEIVNTALEALTDLASPEIHPLAKVAKDSAAAAVLVASLGAVLVGLAVLGPPLWRLAFGD